MNKFSIEMDDGELDFPNEQMLSCLDMTNAQSSCAFDIDEFLGRPQPCNNPVARTEACLDTLGRTTQACTHAHSCNPSGPDKSHTHTCFHVHTQIMPTSNEHAPSDDTAESFETNKDKTVKQPLGNREAVRKYREKKKARTASLEDEVVKLRAQNQQLMKKVQLQAVLEAENARLKCLLVDIRGRIEGELGSFPYQKPVKTVDNMYQNVQGLPGTYVVNPCNMQGSDQVYCLHSGSEGAPINDQVPNNCGFDNLQCMRNQNSGLNEISGSGDDYGNDNAVANVYHSSGNKRKGGTRVARAG